MFAALARVYRAVILKHPALVLSIVVIATVAAALGLPHFKLDASADRSEEHTSELKSRGQIVCRLLLEKKIEHLYMVRILIFTIFINEGLMLTGHNEDTLI